MTLGAIAELTVKDYKVLNDPIMHRIPSMMSVERGKLYLGINTLTKTDNVGLDKK